MMRSSSPQRTRLRVSLLLAGGLLFGATAVALGATAVALGAPAVALGAPAVALGAPAVALGTTAVGYTSASDALAPSAITAQSQASSPAEPFIKQHIYSETTDPRADIASALQQAKREHKRVILDFGGDWCGDCQVLNIYLHQSPNMGIMAKNFILVNVFIGHMDKNLELAAKYGVPVERGVPALAVLDASGKVLYSQATGQFSSMRRMDTQSVTDFLNKWKA